MMTTGNSRPFAACIVISQTRASACPAPRRPPTAATGDRRSRRARLGFARLVLARGRDELHQVLDARLGLLAAVLAKVLPVAAAWSSTLPTVIDTVSCRAIVGERRRAGPGTPSAMPSPGRSDRCSIAPASSPTASCRRACGCKPAASSGGGFVVGRPASTARARPSPPCRCRAAGTLTTRRKLTSSCGLSTSFR